MLKSQSEVVVNLMAHGEYICTFTISVREYFLRTGVMPEKFGFNYASIDDAWYEVVRIM